MKKIPVRHLKAAQKEPDFFESFKIRDVQSLLDGKDMSEELHRHNFFYILALKEGTGKHEIDFTSYTISDNAIFFIRPGQVHQLTLKAGSTGFLVQFRDEFHHDKGSNQLLRKASTVNHWQLNAERFKKLLAILTQIFEEYTQKQERYQDVIRANINIFFIELIRQHTRTPPGNITLYMQERLEELLTLLETHVFNHKQVSHYAGLLNLSPYQLNAITKTTLGKTSSELINDYIILEAKRQLLATSNLVNQIADTLGYDDNSYFIRFFKKHTGFSPEAFRHNFR